LESFCVLYVALIDKDKRFSEFSLQYDKKGLDGPVNSLLLFGGNLLISVLTEELNVVEKILFLRLFDNVVYDINVPVDSSPLFLTEMGQFHLPKHFNSDRNVDQ
jgi:hypothetical protein